MKIKKGQNIVDMVVNLKWEDEILDHMYDEGNGIVGVWELDTWSKARCGLVARTDAGALGFSWTNDNPGHQFLAEYDLQINCYNVSDGNRASYETSAFSLSPPVNSHILPPYPWGTKGKVRIWHAGNLKMNMTEHTWAWAGLK
jgi:hypothetical protein